MRTTSARPAGLYLTLAGLAIGGGYVGFLAAFPPAEGTHPGVLGILIVLPALLVAIGLGAFIFGESFVEVLTIDPRRLGAVDVVAIVVPAAFAVAIFWCAMTFLSRLGYS